METSQTKSYIGITGVTKKEQVFCVLNNTKPFIDSSNLKIMIGVLACHDTIDGKPVFHGNGTKDNRYPMKNEISDIFISDENIINLIHFNTDRPHDLHQDLKKLLKIGGENLHGIQLNMPWPDHSMLWCFKKHHPNTKLVLQVPKEDLVYLKPNHLVKKLESYISITEYVILDPSRGFGKELDPKNILKHAIAISKMRKDNNAFNIVIAGGLCAKNIGLIEPIFKKLPHISIDAQGKLRGKNEELLIEEAIQYVKKALFLMN